MIAYYRFPVYRSPSLSSLFGSFDDILCNGVQHLTTNLVVPGAMVSPSMSWLSSWRCLITRKSCLQFPLTRTYLPAHVQPMNYTVEGEWYMSFYCCHRNAHESFFTGCKIGTPDSSFTDRTTPCKLHFGKDTSDSKKSIKLEKN